MKFVACQNCPLRALPLFTPHSSDELSLIESLKKEQIVVPADAAVIHEGQTDAPLYTLFNGWAFRYKTLSDGRRQILNFLLPGDFIGVQQKMGDASAHGVQALTDVALCVFRRDALWELHRTAPTLGFSATWLTAHEESVVDDTLRVKVAPLSPRKHYHCLFLIQIFCNRYPKMISESPLSIKRFSN